MKKSALTILIILAALWFLVDRDQATRVIQPELARESVTEKVQASTSAPAPPGENESAARLPAQTKSSSPSEIASLNEMASIVSQFTQPDHPLTELVDRLQKSGQEPKIFRDANSETGEMIIVRGDSPLPGTRYFHAQYFTDDAGERFVQHMSFEFKPAPDAMAAAISAVEKNFNVSSPTHRREDYVRWKLGDHKIVWVKRLSDDDMAHDPFNAYSAADRGAVRLAVEDDVHAE